MQIPSFEFSTDSNGFSICYLFLSMWLILVSSGVSGLLTGVSDSPGNAVNEVADNGTLEEKLYSISDSELKSN